MPPSKKKKKGAKDPAVFPDKHAPVPPDLRKRPPEDNFMTTVLMPVGRAALENFITKKYFQTDFLSVQCCRYGVLYEYSSKKN
jgi:hypothetical protein